MVLDTLRYGDIISSLFNAESKMAISETIIFNSIKFRRYPKAKQRAHRVYYWPGGNHRKRGVGALHQEIWKVEYGEIPKGYAIHHIDENPLNNDLSNLEAMPVREHSSLHSSDPKHLKKQRKHIDKIRPLSKEWHSSPEGIEWHRQHAKDSLWKNREPIEYTCEQCKQQFTSFNKAGVRFCSNNCKSQWRRDSGIDSVKKACVVCGSEFIAKDKRVKHCSRKCAGITSSKKRLAKESGEGELG